MKYSLFAYNIPPEPSCNTERLHYTFYNLHTSLPIEIQSFHFFLIHFTYNIDISNGYSKIRHSGFLLLL